MFWYIKTTHLKHEKNEINETLSTCTISDSYQSECKTGLYTTLLELYVHQFGSHLHL